MHQKYHDILRYADRPPLWWDRGVPRFEPFDPEIVASYEVALVHTQCQDCLTRYDVAVRPSFPLFHSLRDTIAFTNSLEIGDPPFACVELGAKMCAAGYSMNSLEIEILEFWHRSDLRAPWQRDKTLEKPLIDFEGNAPYEHPVHLRIYESDKREDWMNARKMGDLATMEKILIEVGCSRPVDVANMVDLDRRYKEFERELRDLRDSRRTKISSLE